MMWLLALFVLVFCWFSRAAFLHIPGEFLKISNSWQERLVSCIFKIPEDLLWMWLLQLSDNQVVFSLLFLSIMQETNSGKQTRNQKRPSQYTEADLCPYCNLSFDSSGIGLSAFVWFLNWGHFCWRALCLLKKTQDLWGTWEVSAFLHDRILGCGLSEKRISEKCLSCFFRSSCFAQRLKVKRKGNYLFVCLIVCILKKCYRMFHEFVCHPCAGLMLMFFVWVQI